MPFEASSNSALGLKMTDEFFNRLTRASAKNAPDQLDQPTGSSRVSPVTLEKSAARSICTRSTLLIISFSSSRCRMRKSWPSILLSGGERAETNVDAAERDCRHNVTASPAKSSKMAFWQARSHARSRPALERSVSADRRVWEYSHLRRCSAGSGPTPSASTWGTRSPGPPREAP